jgi:DegV family protein with EDD domain
MTVRVVTDSTCDLPEHLAREAGIIVLPAYINIGDQSYLDGVELTRQTFYEQLPHYAFSPTTAAPAVGAFTEVYERLAAEGATAILSIHVAGSLSGILNAAQAGANATEAVPVELFDSQQLSMGLGLLALTAARAAAAGHTLAEIVSELNQRVRRTRVLAVLDTLEFLRKSGRVSWAEFGLGTLLKIKPLISVQEGEAKSIARIRTHSRAVAELIQLANSLGPMEQLAILHTAAEEEARQLRQRLSNLFPGDATPEIVEVTPAIGAHIGPKAVGLACILAAS